MTDNRPISDEEIREAADNLEAAFVDVGGPAESGMQFPAAKPSKAIGILRTAGGSPSLSPEQAKEIIQAGHKVYIIKEENANGSGTFDGSYAATGAEMVSDDAAFFESSDIVVKAGSFTKDEIASMRAGQIAYGRIDPAENRTLVDMLLDRKVTALASEQATRTETDRLKCAYYDIAWEDIPDGGDDPAVHFIDIMDRGIESACADNGYLRRSLVTHNGYLTDENTSAVQGRSWVSPEVVLGIEMWTLDQAPETGGKKSDDIYPEFRR